MICVGVSPLYDRAADSIWMIPGYLKMIERCGAVPLIMPLTSDRHELDYFLRICSGFLLTGGQDVTPSLYGAERLPECGETCPERDRMEKYLLQKAIELDIPVLGICRGIQLMNVCGGGTLYQDLDREHPSAVEHHMQPPYDRAVHDVTIVPFTPLYRILDRKMAGVNSYHHQGIKDLSPHFLPMAYAPDGLIEGIFMPDRRFIIGLQWHPELNYEKDQDSVRIIRAFTDAMDLQDRL